MPQKCLGCGQIVMDNAQCCSVIFHNVGNSPKKKKRRIHPRCSVIVRAPKKLQCVQQHQQQQQQQQPLFFRPWGVSQSAGKREREGERERENERERERE